jgi:CheY-like chemotaxis protein
LIDDNEVFRQSVAAMLSHEGYDVIEAANGEDGARLFIDHKPDLVITDMVMPGMNGIETMLELWRDYPHARFIAISGSARAFNAEFNLSCAKEMGALHTFVKPLDRGAFLAAVADALAPKPPASEPIVSLPA